MRVRIIVHITQGGPTMFSSMFRASLMAGALALSVTSTAALAESVIPFTVNPGVIGAPQGSFTASYMDFSYVALVDQVAAGGVGTFTEEGAGFFSSFRHPDLATVVTNTGINQNYKIYGVFAGAGTVAPTVTGGLTATFTDFNLRLFADPQMNTTIIADATGPPNGTVSIGGTIADDFDWPICWIGFRRSACIPGLGQWRLCGAGEFSTDRRLSLRHNSARDRRI
jgi:hypothetical protein